MTKTRLTPDSWLHAGFDALVETGPQAIKAEALARTLGATKGSFYWHFKDVPVFHSAMVHLWADQAVGSFIEPLSAETTVPLQLRRIGESPASSGALADPRIETALRAWANSNEMIASALISVDAERKAHLAGLLRQLGVTDPDFTVILYAAWVGLHVQSHDDVKRPLETLVDLVLALR